MSTLASLAAGSGRWTAVSAFACLAIQLTQLVILGRLLSPADFGLMAMMMVVIGVACQLSDGGLSKYVVYVRFLTDDLFSSVTLISFLLGTALALLIIILSPWAAIYFQAPTLADTLPFMAIVVTANSVILPSGAFLQRHLCFRQLALIEIVSTFAGLTTSLALAWYSPGVWALAGGQIVLSLVKASWSFVIVFPQISWKWRNAWAQSREVLRFGRLQIGERLFVYFGLNIDKMIIGRLLGENVLGLYSIIYQLVVKPFSVVNPVFTRVAFPLFSRLQDDDEQLCRHYIGMTRLIALLCFPVYMTMILASDMFVALMLGDKWQEAARLMSILGWLGFLFTLGNPVGTLILAKGRPEYGLRYTSFSMLVYAAACVVGSHFGIEGIAWGFLLAVGGILFPLEFFLRWKLVGMSPWHYLHSLRHLALAALIPLAAGLIALSLLPIASRDSAGVALALSAVAIYSLWIWFRERPLLNMALRLLTAPKVA